MILNKNNHHIFHNEGSQIDYANADPFVFVVEI